MGSLREERGQNLFHILALALGTVRTPFAVVGQGLDAIEHMVAVAAAIFVGRHTILSSHTKRQGASLHPPPGIGFNSKLCK
jgi:hypothetical protein